MKNFSMYGYEFTAVKDYKRFKVSSEKFNLLVAEGKTQKEAVSNARNKLEFYGQQKTDEAFNRALKKIVRRKFVDRFKGRFEAIFGFPMPICVISRMLGSQSIDPVRFDQRLGTPEGISTYDYVRQTKGDFAVKLLKKLI